jgi:hypothetical protein
MGTLDVPIEKEYFVVKYLIASVSPSFAIKQSYII